MITSCYVDVGAGVGWGGVGWGGMITSCYVDVMSWCYQLG